MPRRHNPLVNKGLGKPPCRFWYLCWNLTLENNWAGFIAIFCKDDDTGNHWQHAWPPQYRSRQLANPDCIQRKVLITPAGVDKN